MAKFQIALFTTFFTAISWAPPALADPQSGAISSDRQAEASGGGLPRKNDPAFATAIERTDCVEVNLGVPKDVRLGSKEMMWNGNSGGGFQGSDEANLRTKDTVDRVSWNSGLAMSLTMNGIRRKLGTGVETYHSYKLLNYKGDDHSIYGSFLLIQHPDQYSGQFAKNQAFDAVVFYVDGEANLPKKANVDCQQLSWFDPSLMEWGKCYWLAGDSKDPRTGKPYCW